MIHLIFKNKNKNKIRLIMDKYIYRISQHILLQKAIKKICFCFLKVICFYGIFFYRNFILMLTFGGINDIPGIPSNKFGFF